MTTLCAGLLIQVQDTVLVGITDIVPQSAVNKQYYALNIDKQLQLTDGTEPILLYEGLKILAKKEYWLIRKPTLSFTQNVIRWKSHGLKTLFLHNTNTTMTAIARTMA